MALCLIFAILLIVFRKKRYTALWIILLFYACGMTQMIYFHSYAKHYLGLSMSMTSLGHSILNMFTVQALLASTTMGSPNLTIIFTLLFFIYTLVLVNLLDTEKVQDDYLKESPYHSSDLHIVIFCIAISFTAIIVSLSYKYYMNSKFFYKLKAE